MNNFLNKLYLFKRYIYNNGEKKYFEELMTNQNELNYEEMESLNLHKRKALVNYSYINSKFYREKYSECGFKIGDIRSDEDFEKLPTLDKHEIALRSNDIITNGYKASELNAVSTGGTTGAPLTVFRPKNDCSLPISWRTLEWLGVTPSDNSGYMSRVEPTTVGKLIQRTLMWPSKRSWIAATNMTDKNMMSYYLELVKSKTKYIIGYVGSIEAFANFLDRNSLYIETLKCIVTTAAPLPEFKRAYLENQFQCKVYSQYGSCEFYWLGSECEHQSGLHVATDIRYIEILDGNKNVLKNEFGNIHATDLDNWAFPLIRYDLGDQSRMLSYQCKCKRPFKLMDYVKGRSSDFIILKCGSKVPGEFWTTIFDNWVGYVKSFNVEQFEDYFVSINVEINEEKLSYKEKIIIDIRSKIPETLEYKINFGSIPISINGKVKYITSHVNSQCI
jgi:phenylacetate-CoA ligase